MTKLTSLAVFCGSNMGHHPEYSKGAEQLAAILLANNITLVYGGANVGIMKVIADAVLAGGGKVIGVIPQTLVDVEIAHRGLTELYVVTSMSRRKELIGEISDGFVLLPGGAGSLDEIFEMFTFAKLGYHEKPCGILNTANYYDHLIKFLDHAVMEGFIQSTHRDMLLIEESPEGLFKKFLAYQPSKEMKWIKK